MKPLTYHDIAGLRSNKWEAGGSGASYFVKDNQDKEWQVLLPERDLGETELTFVAPNRHSMTMTREEYEAIFK